MRTEADEVRELRNKIVEMFAERHYSVVAMTLADVVAVWAVVSCWGDPAMRDQSLELFMAQVKRMIPINEKLVEGGVTSVVGKPN